MSKQFQRTHSVYLSAALSCESLLKKRFSVKGRGSNETLGKIEADFLVHPTSTFNLGLRHPRRPRGSQSGWVKRRDESFQAWAEEPLGTDSHRTISKRSRECWLLIGHQKCFVLLCPVGEQFLQSSFREFVHDCY